MPCEAYGDDSSRDQGRHFYAPHKETDEDCNPPKDTTLLKGALVERGSPVSGTCPLTFLRWGIAVIVERTTTGNDAPDRAVILEVRGGVSEVWFPGIEASAGIAS
jgi:hypothetical protein